jgi:hypothetical protein
MQEVGILQSDLLVPSRSFTSASSGLPNQLLFTLCAGYCINPCGCNAIYYELVTRPEGNGANKAGVAALQPASMNLKTYP